MITKQTTKQHDNKPNNQTACRQTKQPNSMPTNQTTKQHDNKPNNQTA